VQLITFSSLIKKAALGYRTIDGSLNLKPYLTTSCNMSGDSTALGFVEL